jgi:histidinol-phosphatase (PHP family)
MGSNFHTHSVFCDGKDAPEALCERALELGFEALGFSGHSPLSFDPCGMRDPLAYRAEISRLKEVYRGRLDIFCGIEQDYFSGYRSPGWDYVIGSVHYVKHRGQYLPVDWSAEETERIVRQDYEGDALAFCEDYYALVGQVAEVTGCDIIGHFDLIRKYDEAGTMFPEDAPRYRAAVLSALDRLHTGERVFEINTGAMAKGYRTTPYPSDWILRELKARGARIMLGSDCHDRRFLDYGFDRARAAALRAGFRTAVIWSSEGFAERPL